MRTSRSLLFSILFLVFTTFTAAWPWPRWLPELDAIVVRRQNDNNGSSNTPSAAQTRAPTSRTSNTADSTITDPPSSTGSSNGDSSTTGTGPNSKETGSSGARSGTGTGSNKSSSRTATKTRTTSYDASYPVGGVSIVTPAVIDGEQYYKIGDFVTFAWNYTSLEATPSAVNIVASCKANNQVYTIAMNQTITNSTQAVTWDTSGYQQTAASDPLLTEHYTLIIYDAAGSITDTAQPGYLAVYKQHSFGMYTPQPYTPLGEWVCATCSGALSDIERRALGMVVGMSLLTVLSFTWFVGGTGIIW